MGKMKRMTALLLAFLLTLSNFPVTALAAEEDPAQPVEEGEQGTETATEIVAQGTCGNTATWVLDSGGTLTIEGSGAMRDYSSNASNTMPPWYAHRSNITALVVGENITRIGNYAFAYLTGLTGDLVIHDGIETIGSYAFAGCTGLKGLVLPEGLTTIGACAFQYCTGLSGDLILPDSLTKLGGSVFRDCTGFNGQLVIGDGLTEIPSGSFGNDSGFTSIVVGEKVEEIYTSLYNNNHAFYYMSGVKEVTFKGQTPPLASDSSTTIFYGLSRLQNIYVPAEALRLYMNAFGSSIGSARIMAKDLEEEMVIRDGVLVAYYGDSGEVILPDTVREIGTGAFQNCTHVTSVTLPDGLTTIGDYAFRNCTALAEINLPDTITSIGTYAFYSCRALTGDLILPADLENLGTSAFYSCSGLNGRLVIPDGVTEILKHTFRSTAFTSIVMGAQVEKVEQYAFESVSKVTEITFRGAVPPEAGTNGSYILSGKSALKTVYVPQGSYTAYMDAYGASLPAGARVLLSGVTGEFQIEDGVLLAYTGTGGEVVLPQAVTAIANDVFRGNTALTRVVLHDGITSIGAYAFYGCTGLTGIDLPDSLTSIGQYAFYGCTKMAGELVIPAGVSAIPKYAFYNCNKLTGLSLPDGLTIIDQGAFQNCYGMTGQLILPDSITTISSYAFNSCKGFTGQLVLPESLTGMSIYTFQGCTGFTGELVIPDGVTALYNGVFGSMSGITSLVLGEGLTKIDTYSGTGHPFSGMRGVKEVTFKGLTVPQITYSSYGPFNPLYALETVYVPEEAYSAYAEAYGKYLPEGVQLAIDGETSPFEIEDGVLVGYFGNGGEIVIPEEVTVIGDSAFANHTDITGVVFHDGVIAIGSYAFSGCTGLRSLRLSDSITVIGDYAFHNCSGLSGSLDLPENLTTIGQYAFYYCTGLTGSLDLPDGLTSIGQYAFYNCNAITGRLVVPDGVTKLENNVFRAMRGITTLEIGANVAEIYAISYEGALYNMSGVREVIFRGTTVPKLSYQSSPFTTMKALTAIHVPEEAYEAYINTWGGSVPSGVRLRITDAEEDMIIRDGTLVLYQGAGGEVVIPEEVTAIGTGAFHHCTTITGVTFHEGVTAIGNYAFYGCTGLTGQLILPDSITTIGDYAFYLCKEMSGTLVIPGGVTTIGKHAFGYCYRLSELVIEAGVDKTIGDFAFYHCERLTGLSLGEGITTIGGSAFSGCRGLTGDLVLPDSITSIGGAAFSECIGFDGTLTLPENLTTLGQAAFRDSNGFVGELILPDKLTGINNSTFAGLSGITSLVIGESVGWIAASYDAHHAFYGMSSVAEITFRGTTVPSISGGSSPFRDMAALTAVYVPAEAYDAYVAAYGGYVAEGVIQVNDPMRVPVTDLHTEWVGSKSVTLAWDAHPAAKVIGYTILRSGEAVGSTAACTFTDNDLEAGESYTYTVYGYAADGTTTGAAELTVTTLDLRILSMEAGNEADKIGLQNTLQIGVAGAASEVSLFYLQNGEAIAIGTAAYNEKLSSDTEAVYTISWDITEIPDGQYELLARAADAEGTTAELSKTFTVDHSTPAVITDVMAISDANAIHVTWGIAGEANTVGYVVYRRSEIDTDFYVVSRISDRSVRTYIDNTARNDRIYYYYVVGVNDFGQEGLPSEIAGATLAPDGEAPIVLRLTPTNGGWLRGEALFTMESTDNVAVTRTLLTYSVDGGESWNLFGEGRGNTFSAKLDTTVLPDGELRIRADAQDAAGNRSTPLVYVYRVDNHGPEAVQDLSYTATNVTITLRWADVADEDLHFYRVEQKQANGTYVGIRDVYDTLGLHLTGLTAGTEYTYRVVAYDRAGNRGTASAELTAVTLNDQTAPVITQIRPLSGWFNDRIHLTVRAEDEQNVASVTVQVSADGMMWQDIHTEIYTDTARVRDLSYTLELEGYAEGDLYVRAIAMDSAENRSDSSETAPFVQHKIDRTIPDCPEQVKAVGHDGYIEVSWVQGSETDLAGYVIYRSKVLTGPYELLKADHQALNYIDREVEEGVVYYYQIAVRDHAGNESLPRIVYAEVLRDTSAPVLTLAPASGESMGAGYKTISATATDDRELSAFWIEYSTDGQTYTEFCRVDEIGEASHKIRAQLPLEAVGDGRTVYVRAAAEDLSGNRSDWITAQYTVDLRAPEVRDAQASFDGEKVEIRWSGLQESDLLGYKIYRRSGALGYTLIAQRQAAAGAAAYTCYDYEPAAEAITYTYKVEAMDACGNTSAAEVTIELPDRSMPRPVIACAAVMETGVEYYIDGTGSRDNTGIESYLFDFGDGTTSAEAKPIHVYTDVGEYTITLTVIDKDGNRAIAEQQVIVRPRGMVGTAKIRVVDQNGKPVPNASVYFDLETEQQVVRTTDQNGYVTFTADVGKHMVGCVIPNNSWLPTRKEVIVTAGSEAEITMILVRHMMIEGNFEIERMTFEEIAAEGIDVSKPENQHYVRIDLQLTYGTEIVETSIKYNERTGDTLVRPTIIPTEDGHRQIIPTVIPGPDGITDEAVIAYLDIPVGASALKEFFDVKLHILNHAAEDFSMVDNVVELHLPKGLTLVESFGGADSTEVTIREIRGQSAETITWHLRGDKIGKYDLTAGFSGVLSAFNTPIHVEFRTAEPIEVRGLQDLKLTAELPDRMENGVVHYNMVMENTGDHEIGLPKVNTGSLLLGVQLLDAQGREVTLDGAPQSLPAGHKLIYRFMQIGDRDYADLVLHLQEVICTLGETYGMTVEVVLRPVNEIRKGLSVELDRSEDGNLSARMTLEPCLAADKTVTFAVVLYDADGRMTDLRMINENILFGKTTVTEWVTLPEGEAANAAVMALDAQSYLPVLPMWSMDLH